MSRPFSAKLARLVVAFLPGLALFLAGCDQEGKYPEDLVYPSRTDLIVTRPPEDTTFYPDRPGERDHQLAALASIGGQTLNPQDLPAADHQDIDKSLTKIFGTPSRPTVHVDKGAKHIEELRLTDKDLEQGATLYRRHCLHCHGLNGDGRGSSGPWLNPHPRDYRMGLFKFVSTAVTSNRKPSRADLLRTLRVGIDGTSMPAFSMLEDHELDALVSYVIHLSLRGEIEKETMVNILKNKGRSSLSSDNGDINEHMQSELADLLAHWTECGQQVKEPPAYPLKDNDRELKESIRRGYALFTDPNGQASCIGCHLDFGRSVNFRYDDWGTLVRPANLTAGVYRGGRRPIDLYWRISGGIPGSAMPAAALQPEQYWDLVNFVRALPYPNMLPEDLRDSIYPMPRTEGHEAHAER